MNKWLHRNSFSYRRSSGVPHKFSAKAQQMFVKTYRP
ncbi:winged helix-turn-helix domain-containing protein [Providencia rettgeri]